MLYLETETLPKKVRYIADEMGDLSIDFELL
jgi:hypothetical protein